ncbi:hypothetical protein D9M68_582260 [compost metagenome]
MLQGQSHALTFQLHAQQIKRVVHPYTDTQRNHRQRGYFESNIQLHHQCFGEQRRQNQRQNRHHHRTPTTEGQQAEQRDGRIHGEQHLKLDTFDDDVGGGLYS